MHTLASEGATFSSRASISSSCFDRPMSPCRAPRELSNPSSASTWANRRPVSVMRGGRARQITEDGETAGFAEHDERRVPRQTRQALLELPGGQRRALIDQYECRSPL